MDYPSEGTEQLHRKFNDMIDTLEEEGEDLLHLRLRTLNLSLPSERLQRNFRSRLETHALHAVLLEHFQEMNRRDIQTSSDVRVHSGDGDLVNIVVIALLMQDDMNVSIGPERFDLYMRYLGSAIGSAARIVDDLTWMELAQFAATGYIRARMCQVLKRSFVENTRLFAEQRNLLGDLYRLLRAAEGQQPGQGQVYYPTERITPGRIMIHMIPQVILTITDLERHLLYGTPFGSDEGAETNEMIEMELVYANDVAGALLAAANAAIIADANADPN